MCSNTIIFAFLRISGETSYDQNLIIRVCLQEYEHHTNVKFCMGVVGKQLGNVVIFARLSVNRRGVNVSGVI